MKYKHFVFDVDGTLLDSGYAVLRAWQDTLLEIQHRAYETSDFCVGDSRRCIVKEARC